MHEGEHRAAFHHKDPTRFPGKAGFSPDLGACGLCLPAQPSSAAGMFDLLPLQVRAMRLSFVGEMGWELHVPRADCVKVYQAVMEAGARHGIANAGYRAIDSLSIEKGPFLLPAALSAFPPAGLPGQGAFPSFRVGLCGWRCGRVSEW